MTFPTLTRRGVSVLFHLQVGAASNNAAHNTRAHARSGKSRALIFDIALCNPLTATEKVSSLNEEHTVLKRLSFCSVSCHSIVTPRGCGRMGHPERCFLALNNFPMTHCHI